MLLYYHLNFEKNFNIRVHLATRVTARFVPLPPGIPPSFVVASVDYCRHRSKVSKNCSPTENETTTSAEDTCAEATIYGLAKKFA